MANEYIADAAIADFNAQQINRGEVLIDDQTGQYTPVAFQVDYTRKGVIPDQALAEYERQRAPLSELDLETLRRYDQSMAALYEEAENGTDVSNDLPDDPNDPNVLDVSDADPDSDEYGEEDADYEEDAEEPERFSNILDGHDDELDWSGLDPDDPETLPTDQEFLDEIAALEEVTTRDAQGVDQWDYLAQTFSKDGWHDQATIAALFSQWHRGSLSTQEVIDEAVERLGKEQAIAAYGTIRQAGLI